MRVTNVSIKRLEKEESRCKGYATIILDDCLAIHDIKIIEGNNRLFVAMPSKKQEDKFYDYVHPIVSTLRQEIEDSIIKEFNK